MAGGLRRWAGGLLPGARDRRAQVERHAREWAEANALERTGPLWVVLGDSTAQAIGASSITTGYVGGVRAWLSGRDGVDWRVLNLSRTGARAADVLAVQLPVLAEVDEPALVSCAIGANDLLRRGGDLEGVFDRIAAGLPRGALLATIPRGLRERRAREVNRHLAGLAADHRLRVVDLWATTGPPWRGRFSADQFHPNDLGYEAWTEAFVAALS